jgi:hypothetical protein
LEDDTVVVVVEVVVVVVVVVMVVEVETAVVVRVPAQLFVTPLHQSLAVDSSPSSHSRPSQYEFTLHEFGPGGAV